MYLFLFYILSQAKLVFRGAVIMNVVIRDVHNSPDAELLTVKHCRLEYKITLSTKSAKKTTTLFSL